MFIFFISLLCSVLFVATANAAVTIEGQPNSYNVAIGDTLPLSFERYLQVGETYVRWEIVSGSGTFIDLMADSTGFIPSSNSVVLRLVTRNDVPIYKVSDKTSRFNFYQNASLLKNGYYGVRMSFDAGNASNYAVLYTFNQRGFGISNFLTDSTYSDFVPYKHSLIMGRENITFQPNSTNYFTFDLSRLHDWIQRLDGYITISVVPLFNVDLSVAGNGIAYVDSQRVKLTSYDVAHDEGLQINAVADVDNKFERWEVVSGSCTLENERNAITTITEVQSDCKIRAVFSPGEIYTITKTPVQYDFNEHIYGDSVSSGRLGVRFSFTASSAGSYTFIVSNEVSRDSLVYNRYTGSGYTTIASTTKFIGSYSETVNLTAGQTVGIIIANSTKRDNLFFINYSMQAYKLTLSAGANGKVIPSNGYASAYSGAKYSIGAEADMGYRFSNWQIVSGSAVVDDDLPYTFASISGDAELKALFKPSSLCTLSFKKQTFNFQKNYYNESSLSTIRFTWTPPDTNYYILQYEPVDSMEAFISDYDVDGSFATPGNTRMVNGTTRLMFKGTPNTPYYWTVQDSNKAILNKSFAFWVSRPRMLNVIATKGGSVNPPGPIPIKSNEEISLIAWAHGGYKFDSWESVVGNVTFSSTKEFSTNVTVKDSISTVKAVFVKDDSAKPLLNITQHDLTNYPEICATVTVSDVKSGYFFYGLDADDFVLTQDGYPIRPEVTNIYTYSGISVVIVVDESSSMSGTRMDQAKESIKSFINSMGPFDRAAIVGFSGGSKTTVHQVMTSNKEWLLMAVDELTANGGTNIVTGTYDGLQQIVNETNPTMLIVFSDGENAEDDNKRLDATIELAKSKNTTIYSIAVASSVKEPLETLATKTGGTYTAADLASDLAELYANIRNKFLSQSILCYQNPDTTQNAELHNVIVSMTFNNITTKDSFQWSEGALPPTISLTEDSWELIKNVQQANTSITISAYISTSLMIRNANVFMRTSDSTIGQFTSYAMRHVRDSLWEFAIPAGLVVAPGIDFYIVATDTAGQTGKTPKLQNPSAQPYTIFVDNDIPSVKVVSVACEDSTSDIKTFTFNIKDSDGISGVTLYYKDSRARLFEERPLAYSAENDTWTTGLPANVRDYDKLFYYLRVTDANGASVRYPWEDALATDACQIHFVDNDSSVTDSVPEDSVLQPSPRDSIVYSLIADMAEIYDKDLDGRADYVRVHFKEERSDNISGVDSIFWNSNRGEWRYVPAGTMKQNRSDGKWFEGYINKPYKYGLTKADSAHPPFLSFNTVYSEELENVKLLDRVGAVPTKATKFPGKVGLKEYMDPNSETPPDTLIIWMSEPIRNVGNERGWENLFRYSESCDDSASQPLNLKGTPIIGENGQQWTVFLDGYFLKEGACLFTAPEASYEDQAGNPLGRGGVKVEGEDGKIYLSEVRPLQAISGIGETPQWIPPEGAGWELLPDSISAISVKSSMPYTAEVYIFSAIATYVTHFKQKFGYDGEMEQSIRGNSGDLFKQGYLHWNNRSEKGRKVGTGIYIWKIFFKFEDGHKESRIVKTGIYRRGSRKK